ncbi:MAG: type ISP restriction/modification enzyme [Acidimicrobiia bacterium]
METAPWQEVEGEGLATFVPRTGSDYYSWSQVTDLFPWIHSGSQFKRTWPIGPSKSVLERRWDALCEARGANRARAMRETSFRSLQAKVTSLAKTSAPLKPIGKIALGDEHEGVKRYGYRSFDRQWAIADNRLADRPRPPLWSVRSEHQVFFTTLTSTKLGRGPVLAATPYVPDLDHFSGRGAKNVMPFWRNSQASEANITRGLLDALSQELGTTVEPEDLAAYVYGLLGTSAFADRFSAELDEGAGPVRVPLTSDADFFDQTAALGRDLLWWHTWGKRFSPDGIAELPTGSGVQVEPVRGYPASFKYDAGDQRLTVGTGIFSPVAPEVWQFEVSGLRVLQSWLAYRMVEGKGRKSSPLDDIRPERWTFTDELLRLLSILEHTIDVTPAAAKLLDEIVSGPLVDPADLPSPTDGERKPPH